MNHMVAHQTDRPHGCNLCGVRYVRKADLMNHLKSHAYIADNEQIEGNIVHLMLLCDLHYYIATLRRRRQFIG